MQRVSLTIDGRTISVPPGTSILKAARRLGISIPTLCHLPGQRTRAVCRICMVGLKGSARLVPACATPVDEGMQVETATADVVATRRTIMEFILAEHGTCGTSKCAVEQLAEDMGVTESRFQGPAIDSRTRLSSDFVTVRPERCIHCDRCIEACAKDRKVLVRAGRGAAVHIAFDDERSMGDSSCSTCGDCVSVCPAGGLLVENSPA